MKPYCLILAADGGFCETERTISMNDRNTQTGRSYDSRLGSDFGNVVTRRSGEEFRKYMTEAVAKATEPGKDKVARDNWLMRINGNSAFVVFDQHNTRPSATASKNGSTTRGNS